MWTYAGGYRRANISLTVDAKGDIVQNRTEVEVPKDKDNAPKEKLRPKGKDDEPKDDVPEPGTDAKEVLERISKNIRDAEERLRKKDAGEGTQQVQRDVVKDIDEDEAEFNEQFYVDRVCKIIDKVRKLQRDTEKLEEKLDEKGATAISVKL